MLEYSLFTLALPETITIFMKLLFHKIRSDTLTVNFLLIHIKINAHLLKLFKCSPMYYLRVSHTLSQKSSCAKRHVIPDSSIHHRSDVICKTVFLSLFSENLCFYIFFLQKLKLRANNRSHPMYFKKEMNTFIMIRALEN